MSTNTKRDNISSQLIEEEHVSIEKKKECLQTAIYDVVKQSPFLGSILQCLDIYYTHDIERAGIMFDAQGKKWEMGLNPKWFCDKANYLQRESVLLHEIYHVTHKHPMRAFLKINPRRRQIMNVAMDMAINQYIKNLPRGCSDCPPKEEIQKGKLCENKSCPGGGIFVEDYYDEDVNGNKTPWPINKPMEFYYNKLIEKYEFAEGGLDPTVITVNEVFKDNLDVIATGVKDTKTLTSTNYEVLPSTSKTPLKINDRVVLVAQTNQIDNGIYDVIDLGSPTTSWVLKRHVEHCGTITKPIYVGDIAVPKEQTLSAAQKNPKGWVVIGTQRSEDSSLILVDKATIIFEEKELNMGSGGDGNGIPGEFDSHRWDANSEEKDMMDATEDLVKRAMQKRGLTYDKLPGFIQDLLQDIDARRAELNYRQLILAAIKKHASGFNREHSWTRPSRRFKNKAPGTRNGKLPHIQSYIDSSGSISIQEANDFLDITDNFMKVGSRKCDLALWHTAVYHFAKHKLGDRVDQKIWQSGGTDVGPTLQKIYEEQPDLAIILTDGCYSDVDYESWMKPNEIFPQILWIISKDGSADHPLTRLGETLKIPDTNMMENDKNLER